MSTFSQNLYNLRTERGYTLESFADAINKSKGTNFTKGTISKWENGRTDPSFQSIIPVAEFFNISVDKLLGIEPPASGAGTIAAKVAKDKDLQELVTDYMELPKEKQEAVKGMIKAMK